MALCLMYCYLSRCAYTYEKGLMGGVVNSWVMKGLFMSGDSGEASCERQMWCDLGNSCGETITTAVERCQSAGFSPCALSSHTHCIHTSLQ